VEEERDAAEARVSELESQIADLQDQLRDLQGEQEADAAVPDWGN
jgi:chaperonin cofactor prefoldin